MVPAKKHKYQWSDNATRALIHDFDKNVEEYHKITDSIKFWNYVASRVRNSGYLGIQPADCIRKYRSLGEKFREIYVSERPGNSEAFPFYEKLKQILVSCTVSPEKFMQIVIQPQIQSASNLRKRKSVEAIETAPKKTFSSALSDLSIETEDIEAEVQQDRFDFYLECHDDSRSTSEEIDHNLPIHDKEFENSQIVDILLNQSQEIEALKLAVLELKLQSLEQFEKTSTQLKSQFDIMFKLLKGIPAIMGGFFDKFFPKSQLAISNLREVIRHTLKKGDISVALHVALREEDPQFLDFVLQTVEFRELFSPQLDSEILMSMFSKISSNLSTLTAVKLKCLQQSLLSLENAKDISLRIVLENCIKNLHRFASDKSLANFSVDINFIILTIKALLK